MLNELNEKDPYKLNVLNLVRATNNLSHDPPMNGIMTGKGAVVFINSCDLLEEVYVKQNRFLTKDSWIDALEPCCHAPH